MSELTIDEQLEIMGEFVLDGEASACASTQKEDENMSDETESTDLNLGRVKVGLDDFKKLACLGEGGFGIVYLTRKITGSNKGAIYAMKELKKAKLIQNVKDLIHTKTERNILVSIRHPFIVEIKYAFQTEKELYLILEYLRGGELFTHMCSKSRLSEDETRFYLSEVVLALQYLHENGIVYRDLKPENVMLNRDGHVKLTDFGMCKDRMIEGDKTYSFCGTVQYMAPEVLLRIGHDKEADLWSIGILAFDMMTGNTPWYGERPEIIDQIKQFSGFQKCDSRIGLLTKRAQDLIRRLLKQNPSKRLGAGADGPANLRAHQFFRGMNWDDIYSMKISPPFVPPVGPPDDTSCFDSDFTTRPLGVPEGAVSEELSRSKQDYFLGFSYVAESLKEFSFLDDEKAVVIRNDDDEGRTKT